MASSSPPADLPPGPQVGILAQTVRFHRDPLSFLLKTQAELGDVFTLRLLTARPLVVVAAPDAVGKLLGADPQLAHAGEGRLKILPFAASRSVFGGDVERHRTAQERIAPAMSAQAITPHRPEMARIAERQARAFPADRPFRLLARMRAITDEIFVRLVLGVRDEEIAHSLIASIQRMLQTPGNPPVTLPGRGDGLVGELGQLLFARRQAPVAHHLARAVEARRRQAVDHGDVLGCMIAAAPPLGTEEIVDELISLLMAAQEPPAIALTWLLDRLAREPALAEQFAAEPDGELAAGVVRETLRLQPPASGVLRRVLEPIQVGDYELPAGATALLPTCILHRDPRGFSEPNSFRPQRWYSDQPSSDPEPKGPYFPFGGGSRRCVGEPLAWAEIETVVPAILASALLTPLSPRPERMIQRATVLVPRLSLLVRARPRPRAPSPGLSAVGPPH